MSFPWRVCVCGMSPPALSRGPSVSLSPTSSSSHLCPPQCWQDPGLFPGSHSPYPGPPPPRAPAVPVTMVGGVLGSQVVQRGPHALSQGASLCLLPWPTAPHVESSCFHAVPARLSQENLLELSSWAHCGGAVRFPPEPGAILGHTRTLMSAGPMERSARGHSWDPQTASQSWPSPGNEVQLAPKENDGCEQLPSWPGASPPDVPEGSRCVGTLVEVDAAESGQLPA